MDRPTRNQQLEAALREAREALTRAHERLGSISTPMMQGDNLAILLCGHFDNPDQEDKDDNGWTPDGIAGYEEVIAAIRDHYAQALAKINAMVGDT